MWRSLVSRLVRVQEASGSNPDTPTKKRRLLIRAVFFFCCHTGEPEASWMSSPSGFRKAESEWGHPPHAMPHEVQHCFGFESRHSDQKDSSSFCYRCLFICSTKEPSKQHLLVCNRFELIHEPVFVNNAIE